MIGVPTKRFVLPCGVDGVPARLPETAESRHVTVSDAPRPERRRQIVAVKLRMPTRTWDGANVDQQCDLVGFEQVDQLVDRSRRVSNRENQGFILR